MKKFVCRRLLALTLSAAMLAYPCGALAEEPAVQEETAQESSESIASSDGQESSGEQLDGDDDETRGGDGESVSESEPDQTSPEEENSSPEESGADDAGEDASSSSQPGKEETKDEEDASSSSAEAVSSEAEDSRTSSMPEDETSSSAAASGPDGEASSSGAENSVPEEDPGSASSGVQEENAVVIASFAELPEEVRKMSVPAGLAWDELDLPHELSAAAADESALTVGGVSWTSDDYSAEALPGTEFHARAVLPEGYALAEGVSLPEIVIVNDAASPFTINDRFAVDGVIYKEIDPDHVQLLSYNENLQKNLNLPEKVVRPDNGHEMMVTQIEPGAFKQCSTLISVNIGVPVIGESAFEECSNLETVTMEESVQDISAYAFQNCAKLSVLKLPKQLKRLWYAVFQGCTSLEQAELPVVTEMGGEIFKGSGLKSVKIPEGITQLDSHYIFGNCTNLETVELPDTLTAITAYAFFGCKKLQSVNLPDGLLTLSQNAFQDAGLTSIRIPSSVTYIGSSVFSGTPITEVTLPASITNTNSGIFSYCRNLSKVTIEDGCVTVPIQCFSGCESLTEISLPDSLTSIGMGAFSGTGLTTVRLPDGITYLDSNVFSGCGSLTSVTLPAGLTQIGGAAFSRSGITSIEIPDGVKAIGWEAFASCEKLTEVVLPKSLTRIENGAFANCNSLTKVEFPEPLEAIEMNAFAGTGLREVSIPQVGQIAETVFSGSALEKITVGKVSSLYQSFRSCPNLREVKLDCADAYLYGEGLLMNSPNVGSVEISGNLSSVGKGVFDHSPETMIIRVTDMAAAEKVRDSGFDPVRIIVGEKPSGLLPTVFTVGDYTYETLGDGTVSVRSFNNAGAAGAEVPDSVQLDEDHVFKVTLIGNNAFQGHTALTSVKIPGSIVRIGESAFESCEKLENVSFAEGLYEIQAEAFRRTALKEVVLPEGVGQIRRMAFSNTPLTRIQLPETLAAIGESAFYATAQLHSLQLPEKLSSIGLRAFESSGLTDITIPDDTSCGNGVFMNCTELRRVKLPKNMTGLPQDFFFQCPSLEEVIQPEHLYGIGQTAFDGCVSLKSISLTEVGDIGPYAFNHSGLTSVNLPNFSGSLKGVFYGCRSLESVVIGGSAYIEEEAFMDCSALKSVVLPDSLTWMRNRAFSGCTSLEKFDFPPNMKLIFSEAFSGTALRNITLPDSVTDIGTKAFAGCANLQTARIGSGLENIGEKAFPGSTRLLANDPRVQMLLVKYLHQDERPASVWNGQSDIPAGAVTAVEEGSICTVSGDLTVGKEADLTIYGTLIVSGSLEVIGTVSLSGNGVLVVEGNGKVTGTDVPVQYRVAVPAFENGSVTADRPYYPKGAQVLLTVAPALGHRLQSGSLRFHGEQVTPSGGVYAFTMPEHAGELSAVFENRLAGTGIAGAENAQLTAGESQRYSAALPQGESAEGVAYSWTADPEEAVILSGRSSSSVAVMAGITGADTPVTLTLTVKQGSAEFSARVPLTVRKTPDSAVVVVPNGPLTLNPGAVQQFSLLAAGAGTLTWKSSAPAAVSVDQNGTASALALGTAVIWAEAGGVRSNEVSVSVTDQVVYAEDLSLDQESIRLTVNSTARIAAAIAPPEATVRGVWSSSDASVAAVDAGGGVRALAPGKAVLTCRVASGAESELTRSVAVEVTGSGITGITINERPAGRFRPGDTYQFTAEVSRNDGKESKVVWHSDAPSVAAVDQNGLVTFVGAGRAVLTAYPDEEPGLTDSVTLRTAVDVSGTLAFPEGRQAAAFKLVTVRNQDSMEEFRTYTDSEGKFLFELMEAGSYQAVSNPYTAGYETLSQAVSIQTGAREGRWALVYPACGTGSVKVLFTEAGGQPAPGVRVSLQCESPYQYMSGYSADDGSAGFSGLSYSGMGTDFNLAYSAGSGAYGSQTVTLSTTGADQTIRIRLADSSVVTGRVVDTAGRGVPDIYVQVAGRGAYTNGDGTYAIRGQITPGVYPLKLDERAACFPAGPVPSAAVTGSGTVTVEDFVVSYGIDVRGRLLLDGRTDNYGRAYVTLYDGRGVLLAGGYASGSEGFGLRGAVRKTGEYRLEVANIYDGEGWYTMNYTAEPVTFSVGDLSQERIEVTLEAKEKLTTSPFFSGDGNALAISAQIVQRGGKFDVTAKYRNNGGRRVTASFVTAMVNAHVDPAYNDGEYGKLQRVVTLDPGQSGTFLIKALADKDAAPSVSVDTKVTVDGVTYDFGRQTAEVSNVTLSAASVNIRPGEHLKVFGETMRGSEVMIFDKAGTLLGMTQQTDESRWYSIELAGFASAGEQSIYATASTETDYAVSDAVTLQVMDTPVSIRSLRVDGQSYDDIPLNSRVGLRTFSHTVDNSLRGDPLGIRTQFENGGQIVSVTYRFAGLDFPAVKEADGSWRAVLAGWRGSGIKQLTAAVRTSAGSVLELAAAEVTVLVDPSGYITDSDTGLPVPGARVTCYVKNGDGSYTLWDAGREAQANPLQTAANGNYGWMVLDGTYRVKAEKEGYEIAESGSLEKYADGIVVPPPALDVNLALIPTAEMSLVRLSAENGSILARFSRYVRDAEIAVRDAEGNPVAVQSRTVGDTLMISGAFQAGRAYEVALSNVRPKSGTKVRYSLAHVSGTVTFPQTAQQADRTPSSSGGGSSRGSGSSGGGRSIFSGFTLGGVNLAPSAVRKAVRINGSALIRLRGKNDRTTGMKLTAALDTLAAGEKLLMRRLENNAVLYQFTVSPQKLSALPDTIDFGVELESPAAAGVFQRHFSNHLTAFTLTQNGGYGFRGHLALKPAGDPLKGGQLYAYAYDPAKNQYVRMEHAAPVMDQNGYLHLEVSEGGIIIVSEGPLVRKKDAEQDVKAEAEDSRMRYVL